FALPGIWPCCAPWRNFFVRAGSLATDPVGPPRRCGSGTGGREACISPREGLLSAPSAVHPCQAALELDSNEVSRPAYQAALGAGIPGGDVAVAVGRRHDRQRRATSMAWHASA